MLWSSVAGVNTYIYAEARTQVGADSDLTPGSSSTQASRPMGGRAIEIDLRPSSSAIDYILSPGQTITFDCLQPQDGVVRRVRRIADRDRRVGGAATALTPGRDGTYGGMTTLSATLTADGAPLLDLSIDFTLDESGWDQQPPMQTVSRPCQV